MNAVSRLGNIFEDVAIKAAVRLASTVANLVLSGLQTIDGIDGADGDRVLVTAHTDPTANGIYQMSTSGWLRTADARQNTDFIDGTLVLVARGAANAGQVFQLRCTDSPVVIGTSALVFVPQSAVAVAQSTATSTASQTISTGSKTFGDVPAGLSFQAGQYVLIYETSAPGNAMLAQITSYAGGLVVSVVATAGSGTHADWTITLTGSPATIGRVPPIGTGNVTGPGASTAGHLATFADATGKVLQDPGIALGALAGRNTLLYGDAGAASIQQSALAPGAAPLPFVGGQPNDNLHLLNDGINSTRDIDITRGRCRDDADLTNLQLAATMVKRLDAAWAAGGFSGSPAGCCDTGTKGASQTWHIFLMAKLGQAITQVSRTGGVATVAVAGHGGGVGGTVRALGLGQGLDATAAITAVTTNSISYANAGPDLSLTVSGVVDLFDVLASQSYGAPTLPSGWTAKQCLGSVVTDSSTNVMAFLQYGDEFWLSIPPVAATAGVNNSSASVVLRTPVGVKTLAIFNLLVIAAAVGNIDCYVSPLDIAALSPTCATIKFTPGSGGPSSMEADVQARCWTDTSASVRVFSTKNASIVLLLLGWRDPRRRLF